MLFQGGRLGMFAAAHLEGDLHRSVEDVIVVLHPARHGVPLGAVDDAVGESFLFVVAARAGLSVRHGRVIRGVHPGQVLENVVIRTGVLLRARDVDVCKENERN